MKEELYLQEKIKDALAQANLKEADDLVWEVIELSLKLDSFYYAQEKEVEKKPATTMKEDLLKRQKLDDIKAKREEAVSKLFDLDDPKEKELYDKFEKIKEGAFYNPKFYKNDLKLAKEELKKTIEANKENYEEQKQVDDESNKDSEKSFEEDKSEEKAELERSLFQALHFNDNIEEKSEERKKKLESMLFADLHFNDTLNKVVEEESEKVVKVEDAKPTLRERLRRSKDKLKKIAAVGAAILLIGSIIKCCDSSVIDKYSDDDLDNDKTIEEPEENGYDQDDEITEEEPEVEEYVATVGDKVFVEDGVKYYSDSVSAQLENNSYETGENLLDEGEYFVNRIAILAKDADGNPTGEIRAVDTDLGVTANQVAESLGLGEDQYDVIAHISRGTNGGEFINAEVDETSIDDLAWIVANDLKSVEKVNDLENEASRGGRSR